MTEITALQMDVDTLRAELAERDSELETLTQRHERLERAFCALLEDVAGNPFVAAEMARHELR